VCTSRLQQANRGQDTVSELEALALALPWGGLVPHHERWLPCIATSCTSFFRTAPPTSSTGVSALHRRRDPCTHLRMSVFLRALCTCWRRFHIFVSLFWLETCMYLCTCFSCARIHTLRDTAGPPEQFPGIQRD